jgi:hypothetical protein
MKMDNEELLTLLQTHQEAAGDYVWGDLGSDRETAMREYYRMPYGNEEEGWSSHVTSDTQDVVEWVLPSLLRMMVSTDKIVTFDPTKQSEVEGAKQATAGVNYVFMKSNNGFLNLYTACKDALTSRNGALHWRKEETQTVSSQPFRNATTEMVALLLQEAGKDAEVTHSESKAIMGPDGKPLLDPDGNIINLHSGRIKVIKTKKRVRVDAFSPEDLLVKRDWTSPLLDECPYVCRMLHVSLSDLHQMGFKDVTPEELGEDKDDGMSADAMFRLSKVNNQDGSTSFDAGTLDTEDDSMTMGWLRMEYVLVDVDGDGIAERRHIKRLNGRILSNEICTHVPMATFSPVLNTHRWDGMSLHDLVGSLQRLHTELLRQTLDNLSLVNNPRTTVLTDQHWNPFANMEDLIDNRPGIALRMRQPDAIGQQVTPFAAGASMPMLQYIRDMRTATSGVSEQSQGLGADTLNNQAGAQANNAVLSNAQMRIELIGRIMAEVFLKPACAGILKLLTEGDMDNLFFELRGEFVEYDPSTWNDQYGMTAHVGLGTGDKAQQGASLNLVMQSQMAMMQYGLVTPKHLYHTQTKIVENAGFLDVENFVQPPQPPDPNKKPEPPLPLQIEQMKMQAEAQRFQAQQQADGQKFQAEVQQTMQIEQLKAQAKLQEIQANLELQASNDQRDGQREQLKAQMSAQLEAQKLEFEKWKAELDARVRLRIAQIGTEQSGDDLLAEVGTAEAMGKPNPIEQLAQMHGDSMNAIAALVDAVANPKPKRIVHDANGRAVGIA